MAESTNIIIGNAGTAGQANSIVLGNTQTTTQISGIYNVNSTGTKLQVVVDNTGKLGTSTTGTVAGNDSFLYYLAADVIASTGNGTNFYLGCRQTLLEQYDNTSGAFFGGNGGVNGKANAAYFQAPATGYYFFALALYFQVFGVDGEHYQYNYTFIEIDGTSSAAYANVYSKGPFNNYVLFNHSYVNSVVVAMTAGDKAYFSFQALNQTGTINNNSIVSIGLDGAKTTYVCGYRVY